MGEDETIERTAVLEHTERKRRSETRVKGSVSWSALTVSKDLVKGKSGKRWRFHEVDTDKFSRVLGPNTDVGVKPQEGMSVSTFRKRSNRSEEHLQCMLSPLDARQVLSSAKRRQRQCAAIVASGAR